MNTANLPREHRPDLACRIGGAANSGSAKPKEELEQKNRENGLEPDTPAGDAGEAGKQGSVGGTSSDERSGQDRASGSQSR